MKRLAAVILSLPLACIFAADGFAQQGGSHVGVLAALTTDRTYRIGIFRHMDTIFPSRTIHRGRTVTELPRAERKFDATYEFRGKRHALNDILERTNTTGLLVIKNGDIAFEHYYLGADEHSRFTSMSVAKSLVSTLVGLAVADGKIADLNRPISEYLPELWGSGYDGVPIKDVLEMSSGVKFVEDYGGNDDLARMWSQCMELNLEPLNGFAQKVPRFEPPGKRFYYRSVDTQVLGWLVNRATGEHLADYLSRKIWQPLGMEQDATWLLDGGGTEAAFCCIQATLRDFGRFGLLFLNGGKLGNQQIVPPSWVAAATTPRDPQVQPGKLLPNYPLGYGYHWWTFPGGDDHPFEAQGVFFQLIYINPRENLVIVKTSADDSFWDDEREAETYAAFDAIAVALRTEKQ